MASVEKRITVTTDGAKVVRHFARWNVWIDGKRQQRAQAFATRAEALAHAARMERGEVRAVPDQTRVTFRQHAEDWLERCRTTRKAATVSHYRQKIATVMPLLGHLQVRQIGVQHIEDAMTQIAAKGLSGRPLGERTVHHTHAVLRNCLTAAKRWGRITDNPAKDAEAPRVTPKKVVMPSMEEVAAMVAAAESPPDRTLILLGALTGMRRGELAALRWSSIDFAGRWIHVTSVVEQAGGASTALVRAGAKTASSTRRIAISDAMLEVLRAHRAHEAALALACGVPLPDKAFLFHQPAGFLVHWVPSALSARVRRIRDRASVRREVQPLHGLRHRYASSLMGTVADTLIAAALGHTDPRVTRMLYQQAEEAGERATAAAADAALGGLLRPAKRGA
jgi:integrase